MKKAHRPNTNEETSIIKEIAVFTSSTYAVQAIMIIRGVVIATVLGPALYGTWIFFRTFFNGTRISELGSSNAMIKQVPFNVATGESEKNYDLQQSCFTWILFITGLISIIVFILSFTDLSGAFATEIRFASFVFFLNGIRVFSDSKLLSERKIKTLSKFRIALAGLNAFFALVFIFSLQIKGLLLGMTLAYIIVFYRLKKRGYISFQLQFNLSLIAGLIKTGFPIMVLSMTFFLIRNIDNLIVFFMLGNTKTGYFGLASFLTEMISHLPGTISAVLFPRMMYKMGVTKDRKQILSYYTKPILILSGYISIILGLIYININIPIRYLFPEYIPSLGVLKIFILNLAFMSIWSTTKNVLIAFDKQRQLFYGTLVLLMSGAVLDIIMINQGFGIKGVAWVSLMIFSAITLIANIYAHFLLQKKVWKIPLFIIKIYAPLCYIFIGLVASGQLHYSYDLVLSSILRSLVFILFCLPLILYIEKQSGILRKVWNLRSGL